MAEQTTLHQKLKELTSNLWWSWQSGLPEMFRAIDQPLWSGTAHNPIVMLEAYPPDQLEERARELGLHSRINYAYRRWQEYMASQDTWGATRAGILNHRPVAYFSAEFGLHESMPIYSGGLGILSGDHLKSASDLGVPLVGVGFLALTRIWTRLLTRTDSPATIAFWLLFDERRFQEDSDRNVAGEAA